MRAYERFIDYVKIHTASSEETELTPTSQCQFTLTHFLFDEMTKLGMSEVYEDEHAYVYGAVPATKGCENMPAIGFIAHIDTIPDFPGENVHPQIIENYDGGDVALGTSGRVLSPAQFPHLTALKGHTLITTDGTTVLGADDKAGIAAILTACENLMKSDKPHGRIAVCFTPDEEVGHGASLLDLERFNAEFAFTVDGEELCEISYETFNACSAKFEINGFNIHPGSAKNTMINASLVAMEINSMLPAGDTPSHTEGREGFFHLCSMKGTVEKAELDYIIRDHSAALFEGRKQTVRHIETLINEKYGEDTVKLTVKDQYRNMAEYLVERRDIISLAENAIRKAGFEPVSSPVRGGTDGSQLTFRGLMCPNIGTGGYCCHGAFEHITAENLDKATEIVLNIIEGKYC